MDSKRRDHASEPAGITAASSGPARPIKARRPYVTPQVTDGEPLVNVTLLSGGANPSSQTPFVP
ncbi:MAG: hypothetical protein IPL40_07745 [Proteobacteria bacterium]|nr:hypothetical protein [Pseudomonadota bacterium]